MSKYYFYNDGDEMCVELEGIKDKMRWAKIKEKEVFEAKMITGDNVFYCREYGEMGETGHGCGKECKDYKPRNGKNGRCVSSANCYEPSKKVLIKL